MSSAGVAPPLPSRARLRTDSKPWYRQFWPWFLIALPASSVAFGFATLFIAVRHADTVVPHEGDSGSYAVPREPARHGEAASAAAPGVRGDGAARTAADAAAPGVRSDRAARVAAGTAAPGVHARGVARTEAGKEREKR
jgi:hypothetical protein